MTETTGTATGAARFTAAHFSLAAIGLAWTLPFLQPYHRFPLTSFYSEWLAIAFGVLALAVFIDPSRWRRVPVPATVLFLAGFILLLALQQAMGLVPYAGQFQAACWYLSWAAALMVLGSLLRQQLGLRAVATVLAWFLVAGGAAGALVGLLQHYGVAAPEFLVAPLRTGVVKGNLAQPNHYASYVVLALISLAYLGAIGRLRLPAAAMLGLPLVYVLGLSGSRGAWVYLAILLVLSVVLLWRLRNQDNRADGRSLLMHVLAIVAAFVAAQWLAAQPVVAPEGGAVTAAQRLFAPAEGESIRLLLAREAWWMFLQSPLLGVGWGQFAWYEFDYRALTGFGLTEWPHNHAHNIVLQLLAETGAVGALLFLGMAFYWLWGCRRAAPSPERWWLLALLGVLGAHSLLEFPLWYSYFLGMAAFSLGAGSEQNLELRFGAAGSVVMLAVLAVAAIALVLQWHGYRDFERLFARDNKPAASEHAAIVSRAYHMAILKPYAELGVALALEPNTDRLPEKMAVLDRVMRFAPLEQVMLQRVLLFALGGDAETARRELARMLRAYPREVPRTVKILQALAADYPAQMAPLLELATSTLKERRATQADR